MYGYLSFASFQPFKTYYNFNIISKHDMMNKPNFIKISQILQTLLGSNNYANIGYAKL